MPEAAVSTRFCHYCKQDYASIGFVEGTFSNVIYLHQTFPMFSQPQG